MAQIQDLRVQATVPSHLPASSSVVGLFVNSTSGVEAISSAGQRFWVGGQATGVIAAVNVVTGGAGTITTGVVFGQDVANQTGLGTPHQWIPFLASNGSILAVPAYALR